MQTARNNMAVAIVYAARFMQCLPKDPSIHSYFSS